MTPLSRTRCRFVKQLGRSASEARVNRPGAGGKAARGAVRGASGGLQRLGKRLGPGRPALPVLLDVEGAGLLPVVWYEAAGDEQFLDFADHFRIAAEEGVHERGVQRQT